MTLEELKAKWQWIPHEYIAEHKDIWEAFVDDALSSREGRGIAEKVLGDSKNADRRT